MSRVLIVLGLLASACSRASKPAVVLISIDTLRADHLPAYGYRGVQTPAIDALRRDAILFQSAWSHCPMTLPSHVSMLTGLLPTEHGVRNNIGFTFHPDRHRTIAQTLHDRGYATGAFVSAFVLRGRTGLRDAFESYDDVDDPNRSATALDLERPGSVTVEHAVQWIDSQKGKPLFLFVHLFEPHAPYVNGYNGEIATADAAVGKLISALKERKIYDDALIILTSDHGEGLGDHGEMQHSVLLYSEELHVPLIVKMPREERANTNVANGVQHTDIAATIASVTHTDFRSGKTARSLLEPANRSIYSETLFPRIHLGWSDLASIIEGSNHYIDSPRPELYDLANDPHEKHDLIEEKRRDAARLRDELTGFRAAIPALETIDPESAASLAALGYVGNARASSDHGPLPNPVDHIREYEAGREDLADGIAIEIALQRNDLAEAKKHSDRILARPNPSAAGLLLSAKVAIRSGDARSALSLLDRSKKLSTKPVPQLELVRGNALAALGRFVEAEKAYHSEISSFPDELGAYATLAALYFAMNDSVRGHATLEGMFKTNHNRAAALLAARTSAAVEDMNAAARWKSIADGLR